jgi:hypothetical protein
VKAWSPHVSNGQWTVNGQDENDQMFPNIAVMADDGGKRKSTDEKTFDAFAATYWRDSIVERESNILYTSYLSPMSDKWRRMSSCQRSWALLMHG